MSSYFNIKKLRRQSKQQDQLVQSPPASASQAVTTSDEPLASPVLDAEDEVFLQRLAAIAQEPESTPPPLPDRPTVILPGGEKLDKETEDEILNPDKVPLPTSPPEVTSEESKKGKEKATVTDRGKASVMSYFALAQNKFKSTSNKTKENQPKGKGKETITEKDRTKAADDLLAAAEAAKTPEQKEVEQENKELTDVLDQLNLAAVNNRLFSFSKESTELLDKFKLVLKDLINGVPTAYGDLEKLLTDSDKQLKKLYGGLPPFLQNLVKSLPTKITGALGPELLAMSAEKPGFDAKQASASGSGSKLKFKRSQIPSLKSLVSAQGAVATMLKSIVNFLKLRFPAILTGSNVLLSLAVFLLLFVFWYCHKRGRETRLEKERSGAEGTEGEDSSFTDDDGSLLDEKTGDSRKDEKPEPELVIGDNQEPSATVADMPSVSHLPEPKGSAPAKEEPLEVPKSK